ncbi:MAG: phosphate signaling complex protein PhoU [Bacillota bacterium]|nr:phosphate signaling complex protein PhoU [Bacillota bacterium]
MRVGFDKELEKLERDVLRMGSIVEEAVVKAIRALANQDLALADEVIANDREVDLLEIQIEEKCIALLALQCPLGRDLRLIGTTLKITTDLERVGDNAVNIMEVVKRIGHEPLIKPLIDIPRMANLAEKMLKDSLDAFVRRDATLAEQVRLRDDEVDEIYVGLYDELMGYVFPGGEEYKVRQAINLLFISYYLERIADHATNIAERVVYLVTGQAVSHPKARAAGRPSRS